VGISATNFAAFRSQKMSEPSAMLPWRMSGNHFAMDDDNVTVARKRYSND
jgi:hypothetical protein